MEPFLRVLTSPTQPQASLHAREKANLLLRTVTFWSCQFINLRILTLREKEGFEPWSEVQRLYGTQLFVNLRKSDAEGKYKAQTSRVKSFIVTRTRSSRPGQANLDHYRAQEEKSSGEKQPLPNFRANTIQSDLEVTLSR